MPRRDPFDDEDVLQSFIDEGRRAADAGDTVCPYGVSQQLYQRCAWYAGFNDRIAERRTRHGLARLAA